MRERGSTFSSILSREEALKQTRFRAKGAPLPTVTLHILGPTAVGPGTAAPTREGGEQGTGQRCWHDYAGGLQNLDSRVVRPPVKIVPLYTTSGASGFSMPWAT